jgi:hypothetical protein
MKTVTTDTLNQALKSVYSDVVEHITDAVYYARGLRLSPRYDPTQRPKCYYTESVDGTGWDIWKDGQGFIAFAACIDAAEAAVRLLEETE